MTTTYDTFLSEVLPYVHDCPEFAAINAIRNACIEFCDQSLYWTYEVPPITVTANQGRYDLTLPTGTKLAIITSAWFGNLKMEPTSEEKLRQLFNFDWRVQQGRPQYVLMEAPLTAIICPIPATDPVSTDTLNLIVALRPTRASTSVANDDLYERWAEVIGYGARARLLDTPNQPYYDPQNAMKYASMFRSGIGRAKIERNRALTRATLSVIPPRLV